MDFTCNGKTCTDVKTRAHLLHHIRTGVMTKLTLDDLDILPRREDFLDDGLNNAITGLINAAKPIFFLPNDICERTEYLGGSPQFVIWMYGVLPCGNKAAVRVEGIPVYVDVAVPEDKKPGEFEAFLRELFHGVSINYESIGEVKRFPLHGFHCEPLPYKRINFTNLRDRSAVIKLLRARNLKLSGDDDGMIMNSFYFAKVAREYEFATADWNILTGYTRVNSGAQNVKWIFSVDIAGIRSLDPETRGKICATKNALSERIERDMSLVCSWDIETHRTIQNGMVPQENDTDFTIFMVNSIITPYHHDVPLVDFSATITDVAHDPESGQKIIMVCGSQRGVIQAHMEFIRGMRPDFMHAFNGATFDWPLYREICRREKLLVRLKACLSCLPSMTGKWADTEDSVLRWNFCQEKVKIDAETQQVLPCIARFPGILDFDTQPIFKKMYPKSEVGRGGGSLNFYLKANKIESKDDMPYKRMFRIYERSLRMRDVHACHCDARCAQCNETIPEIDLVPSVDSSGDIVYGPDRVDERDLTHCCWCIRRPANLRGMLLVSKYCWIDCIRPQQIIMKRLIINDKRQLSTMSRVCLRDSIFRADGMKVRNLIGTHSTSRNIAFSNGGSGKKRSDKDHYPGAYVKPPIRGLNADLPDTGLDFASLYPSLMMTYNYSPDKCVHDIITAIKLLRAGYSLHWTGPITAERGEEKGAPTNTRFTFEAWFVLHRGICDPADTHVVDGWDKIIKISVCIDGKPTIIMTYTDKIIRIRPVDYSNQTDTEMEKIVRGKTTNYDLVYEATPAEIIAGACAALKCDKDYFDGCEHPSRYIHVTNITDKIMAAVKEHYGNKPTREVTYQPVYGREGLPGERMGIFAYIVRDIFNKRVPVKKEWVKYGLAREHLETEIKTIAAQSENPHETEEHLINTKTSVVNGIPLVLNEIIFKRECFDATQRALKVLANTFYGESGNYLSSVYELRVAAGITTAGQANIKRVIAFVRSHGFEPQYGDTDSIYPTCPREVYAECRAKYLAAIAALNAQFGVKSDADAGVTSRFPELPTAFISSEENPAYNDAFERIRVTYWSEMVVVTMRVMTAINEQVSDHLIEDNGLLYLKMAYEEVCFPTALCGKKKYFATEHKDIPNFYSEDIFIRGIDIVKQGQTRLAIGIGTSFMNEARHPRNVKDMITIAEEKVEEFYKSPLDPQLCCQTATYKPHKKNVPVLRFVERMRELQKSTNDIAMKALYEPPEPGDKFRYVIVKKPISFTQRGTRIELKKGDRMEYLRVFIASRESPNPMELDREYYADSAIIGLLARFICYHPRFQPVQQLNPEDPEDYKLIDKISVDNASKYLTELCQKSAGQSRQDITKLGRHYQQIYRTANKVIRSDARERYGTNVDVLHSFDIADLPDTAGSLTDKIINMISSEAHGIADHSNRWNSVETFVGYCQADNISIYQLARIYVSAPDSIVRKRTVWIAREKESALNELYRIAGIFGALLANYSKQVRTLIDDMRSVKSEDTFVVESPERLAAVNTFSQDDLAIITRVTQVKKRLAGLIMLEKQTQTWGKAIMSLRVAECNSGAVEPSRGEVATMRETIRGAIKPIEITYD